MFDKIEVLMSWKLSCGLSSCFLALVMDTFSSICQIIAHLPLGVGHNPSPPQWHFFPFSISNIPKKLVHKVYHHVIFLFVRMNTQHWALQRRSTLPPPSLASEWPRLERQPSEGRGGFFDNNFIGWFRRKPDIFLWLWWVTEMLYLKWQVERRGSKVHIWEGDGEEWGGGKQRSKFWKSRQRVCEEHKAWYFHKLCWWYGGDTWTHGDKSFCAGSNLWIK